VSGMILTWTEKAPSRSPGSLIRYPSWETVRTLSEKHTTCSMWRLQRPVSSQFTSRPRRIRCGCDVRDMLLSPLLVNNVHGIRQAALSIFRYSYHRKIVFGERMMQELAIHPWSCFLSSLPRHSRLTSRLLAEGSEPSQDCCVLIRSRTRDSQLYHKP
jgi:hypothetical protein